MPRKKERMTSDRIMSPDLHLHVKTKYFNEIKNGEKSYEYRLCNDYWSKRIIARDYVSLIIYNAYKPGSENRIVMRYRGYKRMTITHPHFGPLPVVVYGIICGTGVRKTTESEGE